MFTLPQSNRDRQVAATIVTGLPDKLWWVIPKRIYVTADATLPFYMSLSLFSRPALHEEPAITVEEGGEWLVDQYVPFCH